jgi:hypothetical protein
MTGMGRHREPALYAIACIVAAVLLHEGLGLRSTLGALPVGAADPAQLFAAKLRFGVSTVAFALIGATVIWLACWLALRCAPDASRAKRALGAAGGVGGLFGVAHQLGGNPVAEAGRGLLGRISALPGSFEVLAWLAIGLIVWAACALVEEREGDADEAIRRSLRGLGQLLLGAAMLLAVGVIQIDGLYRIGELAIVDKEAAKVVRQGVVAAAGGFYSILLASIFMPAFSMVHTRMERRIMDEARREPALSLPEIASRLRFDDVYGGVSRTLAIVLLPFLSAVSAALFEGAFKG